MIAEASTVLSGIKVAMDMAKGIAVLKNETDINQAVIEIQRVLLEAQSAAFDDKQANAKLSDEIANLRRQLAAFEEWENAKQRYVLTESEVGTFTYELRPEMADDETHHRLCVSCFENGKKSILQGRTVATCNLCEKSIFFGAKRVNLGAIWSSQRLKHIPLTYPTFERSFLP